jgi:hypothetical protein
VERGASDSAEARMEGFLGEVVSLGGGGVGVRLASANTSYGLVASSDMLKRACDV